VGELTGLTAGNLDYFEVYAAVRLAVAMVRAANMMIANGQLPPDAPMALPSPAVHCWARSWEGRLPRAKPKPSSVVADRMTSQECVQ
jgi:hypothetical protein